MSSNSHDVSVVSHTQQLLGKLPYIAKKQKTTKLSGFLFR
jgi:hypothetical protein